MIFNIQCMQVGKNIQTVLKDGQRSLLLASKFQAFKCPPQDNTPDQLKQTHHPHTLGRIQRTTVHFVFC